MDELTISLSWNMRSTTAVTILGWAGVIISGLFIIGGIIFAVIPTTVLFIPPDLLFIISGSIIILVGLLLLTINSFLIKWIRDRSFGKVKILIEIICIIFLILELIGSFKILFTMIELLRIVCYRPELLSRLYYPPTVLLQVFIIVLIIVIFWIVFICRSIHGIRKKRKELLKAYIIFNFIMQIISLWLLNLWLGSNPIALIPSMLGSIGLSLYHIGFFVVLSNIMMVDFEEGTQLKNTKKLTV